MAGFGGDAKVALLTGLISGINQRKETERKKEREEILNRQSEAMISESEARVQNYESTQQRAIERQAREDAASAAATQRAAQEAEEDRARLEAVLPTAMERFGTDEATTRAIITDPDFDMDELIPQQDRAMNDLDRARARDLRAAAEAQELENLLQSEVRDITNDPASLRLRRGIETGDSQVTQAAIFELAESGGYSQEGIGEFMDGIQKSDGDGRPIPMTEQRKRWQDSGTAAATRLVQEADGSIEAAIVRAETAITNLPPDADPSDIVILNQALADLRKMLKAGGGGSTGDDIKVGELANR